MLPRKQPPRAHGNMPEMRRVGIWGGTLALVALLARCGSNDDGGSGGAAGSDAGDAGAGGVGGDASPDVSAVCGNGVIEGSESCDNGPNNAPGSGCELDCSTSCDSAADCDDGEPCNGSESCATAAGGGRVCASGPPPAEGSSCAGGYCKSNVCTSPTCGDGSIEPGEGCEPPGTATCSDDCQVMICGDGAIAGAEQCDDGNLLELDGCDSNCRYETFMRFTSYDIRSEVAPSFCAHPKNAFGSAMAVEVTAALSQSTTEATKGGASNLLLGLGGIEDLTGQDEPEFQLSMLSGTLDPTYPSPWAENAIDAWFVTDPDMLQPGTSTPLNFVGSATIVSRVLTAGPGLVKMRVVAGTTVNLFESRDTRIRAMVLADPAPDLPGPPPPALRPGLSVFRALDAAAAERGLCGGVTVGSLAQIVMPQDFALGAYACSANCSNSRQYKYCGPGQPVTSDCSSLLDLLVGGCKVEVGGVCLLKAGEPTQPDIGSNGNAPLPLTFDANNKVIVDSPTDAYSYYIRFTANRAHVTDNLP
jgi:cysteine-rich repeat protein